MTSTHIQVSIDPQFETDTDEACKRAYYEGLQAGERHEARIGNPYPVGSARRQSWNEGHDDEHKFR